MVSDVSHDRLFGEENAGSRDLSPSECDCARGRRARYGAVSGDRRSVVVYLEALPTPRATNRSGLFLVWVSSWADPIRKLSRMSAGTARTSVRRSHESVPVVYLCRGGSGPRGPEYAREDADIHVAGHFPLNPDGRERYVRLRWRTPWPRRGDRCPSG